MDADATLVETQKKEAFFSYRGYKAYQPFNVWWAEQKVVLHSEFRDGNVPAGYEQVRVFKEALDMLPEGVVVNHDPRFQPQLGDEAVGASAIPGCSKDEGHQVFPY